MVECIAGEGKDAYGMALAQVGPLAHASLECSSIVMWYHWPFACLSGCMVGVRFVFFCISGGSLYLYVNVSVRVVI